MPSFHGEYPMRQRPYLVVGKGLGIAMLGLILSVSGCGKASLYPVHGRVLYQGKPVEKAMVTFIPVQAPADGKKVSANGETDAEGNFTLSTRVPGDGAPAGEYRVTVFWPGPLPGTDPKTNKEAAFSGPDRLQGRYADFQKTTLKATVASQKNQLSPFELQ
jgi:hypothetical protein